MKSFEWACRIDEDANHDQLFEIYCWAGAVAINPKSESAIKNLRRVVEGYDAWREVRDLCDDEVVAMSREKEYA